MLGFDYDEALTLGRAVAGVNAYSKGVALSLFQPTPTAVSQQRPFSSHDTTFQTQIIHIESWNVEPEILSLAPLNTVFTLFTSKDH